MRSTARAWGGFFEREIISQEPRGTWMWFLLKTKKALKGFILLFSFGLVLSFILVFYFYFIILAFCFCFSILVLFYILF